MLSSFSSVPEAGRHCIDWFDVEEETYASKTKFGYERNLRYLHDSGVEINSVWGTQLTQYWDRATLMDKQLRPLRADTLHARQLFAKHANASRALFTTVIARLNNDNYDYGKALAKKQLLEAAKELSPDNMPVKNPLDFDYNDFWSKHLNPSLVETMQAITRATPRDDDTEHFIKAEAPLREFTLNSFAVVASYVYIEGPLPQPGLPSGDVQPWALSN